MSCQTKPRRITPWAEKSKPHHAACLPWRGPPPHGNCERMRRRTWQLAAKALFRGSQGRAEIAQFVVDLVSSSYGLGDFFAEQTAVTTTQPVHEIFHCRFLKAEYPGKCRVRYILPLRREA